MKNDNFTEAMMGNIDNGFLRYQRMKIYRRILFFMLGFGLVLGFAAFYIYEWNRMPEVIYVEADKEQVIDLNIPASGELYKECIDKMKQYDIIMISKQIHNMLDNKIG